MKLDKICNNKGGNKNDECYTPKYAITPILKYLNPNSNVWCPFDTEESNFVKLLNGDGHSVCFGHIDDGKDFFKYTPDIHIDYIISNPPYSMKFEVLKRLFDLKIPFAMLLGVVGLFESQKRFNLFSENIFEIMYLNKRVSYFKDYKDQIPELNPPFQSVFITSNILPEKIIFEKIDKKAY